MRWKWNNKSKYEIGLHLSLLLATSTTHSSSVFFASSLFVVLMSERFIWMDIKTLEMKIDCIERNKTSQLLLLSQSELFDAYFIVSFKWCDIKSCCFGACEENPFVRISRKYNSLQANPFHWCVCVTWNHVHKHTFSLPNHSTHHRVCDTSTTILSHPKRMAKVLLHFENFHIFRWRHRSRFWQHQQWQNLSVTKWHVFQSLALWSKSIFELKGKNQFECACIVSNFTVSIYKSFGCNKAIWWVINSMGASLSY